MIYLFFMKKLFSIIAAMVVALTLTSFVALKSEPKGNPEMAAQPVCKYSLNHYSGTIDRGGYTDDVFVLGSCPLQQDVYATVDVYIEGAKVASELFFIPAGKTKSSTARINLRGYYEAKYTLKVE